LFLPLQVHGREVGDLPVEFVKSLLDADPLEVLLIDHLNACNGIKIIGITYLIP
jgi:hypothetical protein